MTGPAATAAVTQQGRDVVQLVRRRREAWLAQRLQELTDEERATLLAAAPILEKLSQSLDGPGGIGGRVLRLHASSCHERGTMRPESDTMSRMSGLACWAW